MRKLFGSVAPFVVECADDFAGCCAMGRRRVMKEAVGGYGGWWSQRTGGDFKFA